MVEIGIRDSEKKFFIGEQYIVNFQVCFDFVLILADLSVKML
jgi:hypothetical protein